MEMLLEKLCVRMTVAQEKANNIKKSIEDLCGMLLQFPHFLMLCIHINYVHALTYVDTPICMHVHMLCT